MDPVMRISGVGTAAWSRALAAGRTATPLEAAPARPAAAPASGDAGVAGDAETLTRPARARRSPGEAIADAARFWFFGGRSPARERPPSAPLTVVDGAGDRARSLGLGPYATQEEIDRRFREIVKAERPDLGTMRPEALQRLAEDRDALRAAATTATRAGLAARFTTSAGPTRGSVLDVGA